MPLYDCVSYTGLNFCQVLFLYHGLFTIIYVSHVLMFHLLFSFVTFAAFIKNARLHYSVLFNMNPAQ